MKTHTKVFLLIAKAYEFQKSKEEAARNYSGLNRESRKKIEWRIVELGYVISISTNTSETSEKLAIGCLLPFS